MNANAELDRRERNRGDDASDDDVPLLFFAVTVVVHGRVDSRSELPPGHAGDLTAASAAADGAVWDQFIRRSKLTLKVACKVVGTPAWMMRTEIFT